MAYTNIQGKDYNFVRPIVIGVAEHNNKLLLEETFDRVKKEYIYRPLGGGLEFFEDSKTSIKREFMEEINVDIVVKNLICTIENMFTFEDVKRHELVLVYNVEVPDKIKNQEIIEMNENGFKFYAKWIYKSEFISGKKKLFPKGLINYL